MLHNNSPYFKLYLHALLRIVFNKFNRYLVFNQVSSGSSLILREPVKRLDGRKVGRLKDINRIDYPALISLS
jgi:hypothetical protein